MLRYLWSKYSKSRAKNECKEAIVIIIIHIMKNKKNKKICYIQCPSSRPYYTEEKSNILKHCHDICPNEFVY